MCRVNPITSIVQSIAGVLLYCVLGGLHFLLKKKKIISVKLHDIMDPLRTMKPDSEQLKTTQAVAT